MVYGTEDQTRRLLVLLSHARSLLPIYRNGVGLNPMDLLKNLLFTHVRLEQFTVLKDEWKEITEPLGTGEGKTDPGNSQ